MKFSKKYSLVEIEERWYELLYDENASKEAKKKMNSLSREKVRSLLSKIPFSSEEDKLIRSIPSNTSQQQMSILMEDMLIRQSETFHHARTLKILEEHWRRYCVLC
jgi:chemotaxis methyl-accepting protein methylase